MKNKKILILILSVHLGVANSFGKNDSNVNKPGEKNEKKDANPPQIMAGCSPATSHADLDINNTKAMIHTGGDMWWDLIGSPRYEIPKSSGCDAMFSGALWLGGKDVSGQLKVASQTYRNQGNDFWPGPLSTITAEVSPATCLKYDKLFKTTRDEVEEFSNWFNLGLTDPQKQQSDFPDYQIPQSILDWPAHGRSFDPYNEDFFLAPFYDNNNDGIYNPLDGDYPGYDLKNEHDCSQKAGNIYGDQNLWWVFNDKGNIHTQTGAASIGMEIRAQAFAFATNDEVNNMTFYNYELINRSTYTLTETYFGVFADADLGNFEDDLVGCDVMRGLGYCYNGDNVDEDQGGAKGYGSQPPAIGMDFFQGPFQDNDDMDNNTGTGLNEALNGVGYGDGIKDNERFGMRRFIYFSRTGSSWGTDPVIATDYYNYLRGIWKDGTKMTYGADGHGGTQEADFMFPDNTDPLAWGTHGIQQQPWSETTEMNKAGDRRFLHSAGPFTLQPGATNNITTGVVWARATAGGPWASVEALRKADDKTQAMFDNCFRVLEAPDAPDLSIRELDRELIIFIENKPFSNNYKDEFNGTDPFLIPPTVVDIDGDDTMDYFLTGEEKARYSTYYFEGYQIFQVKNPSVSASDLHNPELARLVAQCDIKNGIAKVVNYNYNPETNSNDGILEVNGEDLGICHSFRITEDKFATGDKRLVNHKKVYFMAVSYAYNHSPYNEYDPFDPKKLNGQTKPYLASRKSATGPISVYPAIPHKNQMEFDGTILNSNYGDGVEITRIEGRGNGGLPIYLKRESLEEAALNGRVLHPVYEKEKGPVKIKVIDPLNVPNAEFFLKFIDSVSSPVAGGLHWYLYEKGKEDQGVFSDKSISVENEQLLLNWGISVTVKQVEQLKTSDVSKEYGDDFLESKISFEDENKMWLTGVGDADGITPQNWIRSGTSLDLSNPEYDDRHYKIPLTTGGTQNVFMDEKQVYESLIGGTWAPYLFCSQEPHGPVPEASIYDFPNPNSTLALFKLKFLQSVDIVFTSDKEKWTRCPVLEMQNEPAASRGVIINGVNYYYPNVPGPVPSGKIKGFIRSARSLDKNGNPGASSDLLSSNDPLNPNFISAFGMSWFPGYAVNIETGERLNIAFGEDSWLGAENGNDLIWNPTPNIFEGPFNDVRFGGKHYIFVFRNNVDEDFDSNNPLTNPADRMPSYDSGKFLFEQLSKAKRDIDIGFKNVYRTAMWVGLPLLKKGFSFLSMKDGLIPGGATVSIRVSKPYEAYGTQSLLSPSGQLTVGNKYFVDKGPISHNGKIFNHGEYFLAETNSFIATGTDLIENLFSSENLGLPFYSFNTFDLAVKKDSFPALEDALKLINIVPNPYYQYSEYETDKVDTRVKIINLPENCVVRIYTVNGSLVRTLKKNDNTITSMEWDLKNEVRVPIISGMYIVHVEVPGVGERTLKLMCIMRPVDVDAF